MTIENWPGFCQTFCMWRNPHCSVYRLRSEQWPLAPVMTIFILHSLIIWVCLDLPTRCLMSWFNWNTCEPSLISPIFDSSLLSVSLGILYSDIVLSPSTFLPNAPAPQNSESVFNFPTPSVSSLNLLFVFLLQSQRACHRVSSTDNFSQHRAFGLKVKSLPSSSISVGILLLPPHTLYQFLSTTESLKIKTSGNTAHDILLLAFIISASCLLCQHGSYHYCGWEQHSCEQSRYTCFLVNQSLYLTPSSEPNSILHSHDHALSVFTADTTTSK